MNNIDLYPFKYFQTFSDITQDQHITQTFEVTSQPGVMYWDIHGNVPSYCCSKPNRHWTEAWYMLKFSTPTFVHIQIDPWHPPPLSFLFTLTTLYFLNKQHARDKCIHMYNSNIYSNNKIKLVIELRSLRCLINKLNKLNY